MALLEYIFYVALYGYVLFGFVYYFAKIVDLKSVLMKGPADGLPSIGIGSSSLSFHVLLTLDMLFNEIGVQEIESY